MNKNIFWHCHCGTHRSASCSAGLHAPAQAARGMDGGEREILYWVAPMDANFRRDEPGKSPMGMDLVPVYADEVDASPASCRSTRRSSTTSGFAPR